MNGQAWQKVAEVHNAALRRELNTLDALHQALCAADTAKFELTKLVHAQRAKVRQMQRRDSANAQLRLGSQAGHLAPACVGHSDCAVNADTVGGGGSICEVDNVAKRIKPRVDDIVTHEYLGRGKVVEIVVPDVLALVLYDNTPHLRYNMGENPTVSLLHDLRIAHDLPEQ